MLGIHVYPTCHKHIFQLYDLEKLKSQEKAWDEMYNKPVMVIYDLMRECKDCHYYVLNDNKHLYDHRRSQKHRDVLMGKSKAPLPSDFANEKYVYKITERSLE